ncbi:MAG: hypothetical protein HQL68_00810 [Magnetococcales bacterium]|nr:hypothetical protein [Magnetococcales bacterium]
MPNTKLLNLESTGTKFDCMPVQYNNLESGFINFVKNRRPEMWLLLEKARERGLIVVDEENDAITATNRLMWTNPVLHDCLATMVDQWVRANDDKVNNFYKPF